MSQIRPFLIGGISALVLLFFFLFSIFDKHGTLQKLVGVAEEAVWVDEVDKQKKNVFVNSTVICNNTHQKGQAANRDPVGVIKILEGMGETTKHLWGGLSPLDVHKRWPGLILEGDYILREFVDSDDPQALGHRSKPKDIQHMTDVDAEERFFQLVKKVDLKCADMQRMGRKGDGGWYICVSDPYKPGKDCIVYSFGINNDFSFDDAMGKSYGCKVNSYDPSMKVKSHRRSKFVNFHKIGLGIADTLNSQGWELQSLATLIEQNGHSGKIIDSLKIDIEANEWASLEVILEKGTLRNVKQFCLEIHYDNAFKQKESFTKFELLRYYNILLKLEKQGFRRFKSEPNKYSSMKSSRTGKKHSCCYEMYYININFLKS